MRGFGGTKHQIMAKKENKKIHPTVALNSMVDYHNAVVLLVSTSNIYAQHLPESMKEAFQENINNIKSFYVE